MKIKRIIPIIGFLILFYILINLDFDKIVYEFSNINITVSASKEKSDENNIVRRVIYEKNN